MIRRLLSWLIGTTQEDSMTILPKREAETPAESVRLQVQEDDGLQQIRDNLNAAREYLKQAERMSHSQRES